LDKPLVIGDREYQVGDWVVTRQNNYRLRSRAEGEFVKNGSVGTIAEIKHKRHELVVQFEKEGVIRLPREYVDAGWVEHAYARTTYGVEGATLTSGFYHAGDESTFEEGYVALTRARKQSRIYIVESQEEPDEEWGHRVHEKKHVGLGTVTQALEQRAAPGLAHELDPLAAEAVARFDGWEEVPLLEEQRRLERVLAQAPTSHTRVLTAASRELERLLATTRLSHQDAAAGRRLTALASVTERLVVEEMCRSAFFHEHAEDDMVLTLIKAVKGQTALRADTAAVVAGRTPEGETIGADEADYLDVTVSQEQHHLPDLGIEPPGM
jgi:hypothetical protein